MSWVRAVWSEVVKEVDDVPYSNWVGGTTVRSHSAVMVHAVPVHDWQIFQRKKIKYSSDAVLYEHSDANVSDIHHYMASHLELAPHRVSGAVKGCCISSKLPMDIVSEEESHRTISCFMSDSEVPDDKQTMGGSSCRRAWLHEAVKRKNLELLKHALDCYPSDFGELDAKGRSPLTMAMLEGAWELVSTMLDCKTVDILAISQTDVVLDDKFSTVYHKLCNADWQPELVKVLRELIYRDPNFNVVDTYGNTPLHEAAADKVSIIDVYCTPDSVNAQNYKGQTPLHEAVVQGNMAAAWILLQHDADVRLTDEWLNTPMHIIRSNYDEFRSIFAEVPKTRNVFGQLSPLLWLSPDGDVDVNYRDFLGNSALHILAGANHFYVGNAKLLVSNKLDPKCYVVRNVFSQTPVQSWILSLGYISLLMLNEKVRMSLTTTDGRGRNILHTLFLITDENCSSKNDFSDYIINGYSRQPTPFSSVDNNDITAKRMKTVQSELALKGRWCIYSRLDADLERLMRGGRVNDVVGCCSRDSLGRTPLHYSAMYCNERTAWARHFRTMDFNLHNELCDDACRQCDNRGCWCLCCLHLFGVDCLRVQDAFGRTPMHYAALMRKEPTDKLRDVLLAAGFNVDDAYNDVKDIDGFTPHKIYYNRYAEDVDMHEHEIGSILSQVKSHKRNKKNLDQLWSEFAGRIDTWSVWQKELNYGLYSPDRRQLTEAVNKAITSFMKRLIDAVEHEDTRLRGRLLAVGSAFEQTKLDRPDEFDFNVALMNFKDICQVYQPVGCPPGFRVLRKLPGIDLSTEKYAPYADLFLVNNTLNASAVNFWFQMKLVKVLSSQKFWDNEPLLELCDMDKLDKINPNQLCKTLKLTVNHPIKGIHIDFVISVDVVPVIHFLNWMPEDSVKVSNDIQSEGCNFVFYKMNRTYQIPFSSDIYYVKIAFARAESLSLLTRPAVVNAAYIVAKRIWSHWFINPLSSVSSHVLKTAALSSTSAVGDNDNCSVVSETVLRTQVNKLFAKLYEFAVYGHAVSSFMPGSSIKLYRYEKFPGFSHTWLQRTARDYETLFDDEIQMEKGELSSFYRDLIRRSFVLTYALYAASSQPHSDVERIWP